MTDDIVTRLETLASNYKTAEFEFMYADYETVCEASAEIERLRYMVHHYKGQAESYSNALTKINEQNSTIKVVKGPDPDKVYPKGRYQGD